MKPYMPTPASTEDELIASVNQTLKRKRLSLMILGSAPAVWALAAGFAFQGNFFLGLTLTVLAVSSCFSIIENQRRWDKRVGEDIRISLKDSIITPKP